MAANVQDVATLLLSFRNELGTLRKFDSQNQSAFSSSKSSNLTANQLHLLVETVFFRAYRTYEHYIRDVFLLYCTGHSSKSGKAVTSFLNPRDVEHAEQLMKSSMPFVEWGSPDEVIKRAELYLDQGFPIKAPYTSRVAVLRDYKHIRNHIAHSSTESLTNYRKVLGRYFGAPPLPLPEPGELLLKPDKTRKTKYLLQTYFDTLESLAVDVAA
jgi:hypothetical protein